MKKFIKNFVDWFILKPKLEKRKNLPPLVKEGEIYWFYCGENIGSEISGKNKKFTRPGIIYQKFSPYTFLIIPTSTKIKKGSWFSPFSFNAVAQVACLHQIRVIDYRRLRTYMGEIPETNFSKIIDDFEKLILKKNRSPRISK